MHFKSIFIRFYWMKKWINRRVFENSWAIPKILKNPRHFHIYPWKIFLQPDNFPKFQKWFQNMFQKKLRDISPKSFQNLWKMSISFLKIIFDILEHIHENPRTLTKISLQIIILQNYAWKSTKINPKYRKNIPESLGGNNLVNFCR